MAETRRKFDHDPRKGAALLVRETGKPIAQVARDLGINEGTLGNWVNADTRDAGRGMVARWSMTVLRSVSSSVSASARWRRARSGTGGPGSGNTRVPVTGR